MEQFCRVLVLNLDLLTLQSFSQIIYNISSHSKPKIFFFLLQKIISDIWDGQHKGFFGTHPKIIV